MTGNKIFNRNDIDNMDQRFRNHFINSLSGYKSANLIGTQDIEGNTNLSIVSSVFHLGASPPLMGMVIRPHSVPRHTLENIVQTNQYTINQVADSFVTQAHQTSARYDKHTSEFEETGLTPEYLDGFIAPFVKQSRLKVGLKLVERQTMLNDTELVIGEIEHVLLETDESDTDALESDVLDSDGFVNLSKLNTVAVNGLDGYCQVQLKKRLPYAKSEK